MVDEPNIEAVKEKIDQLNKDAWENRVNDSNRTHLLSRQAFELAESIGYKKGMAKGYLTHGFSLIRLSKHHEALEYLDKALVLFEELNDLEEKGNVFCYYGMIQRSFGNYPASIEYISKYVHIMQQVGNKGAESAGYYHLGVTYKYAGDNETALNYLLKALSFGDTQNNHYPFAIAYTLKQIGLIYVEAEDFENALKYYHKSLAPTQQNGDKWGEAGCLDSIGFCYFKMRQYDEAIKFCSQALSISQSADDKKGEGNALFHLGNIYNELADYTKALECCNNCLIIRRAIKDKSGEAEVLLFLAMLYTKDKSAEQPQQKVFDMLNQALQLGEEIKAPGLLAKIHAAFYESHKHFNDYEKALSHLEMYMGLSKKIDSDAINEKIKNLDISLKAAETDKKLLQALQENEKIVEVERSRLAKDLHDGMGGLLSGIKITLNSVADKVPEQNTPLLNKANNQLDNAIREMRRVAHNLMPEALLKFGLGEAIQDFCDGINESNAVKMKYTQIGSLQGLTQSTEIVLYRIIQELTNNALKHAAAKNIFIQITKHSKGVSITVEDDGKGFDTNVLAKEGQGLKNVQSRIDYLKGSCDIKSEKGNGTSVNIEIPV